MRQRGRVGSAGGGRKGGGEGKKVGFERSEEMEEGRKR